MSTARAAVRAGARSPVVPRPPRGHPSWTARRRAQLIDTVIRLVARHGLEAATLDPITGQARLPGSAVRHLVGNRQCRDPNVAASVRGAYDAALTGLVEALAAPHQPVTAEPRR